MKTNILEEWKDIAGYEGKYQVNAIGLVKSFPRYGGRGKIKYLKQWINRSGYVHIHFSKENKLKRLLAHRLVAIAFIPNPDNLPFVNHKNGIKTDNRVDNLEWCTASQNTKHAFDMGLCKPNRGELASKKLRTEDVLKIRSYKNMTQVEIARKHNVALATIWRILNRTRWAHV